MHGMLEHNKRQQSTKYSRCCSWWNEQTSAYSIEGVMKPGPTDNHRLRTQCVHVPEAQGKLPRPVENLNLALVDPMPAHNSLQRDMYWTQTISIPGVQPPRCLPSVIPRARYPIFCPQQLLVFVHRLQSQLALRCSGGSGHSRTQT